MNLDEAIKRVRSDMGLYQEALARELHVGFTSVNKWENGHSKPNQIARHALVKLCRENNIEPELIEITEKNK